MEQRGRGAEVKELGIFVLSPAPLLKSTSAGFERCGEKSGFNLNPSHQIHQHPILVGFWEKVKGFFFPIPFSPKPNKY
jgi:hypothetical protein